MNPVFHLLHFRPRHIARRVDRLVALGVVDRAPNLWQLWVGTLYMLHRAATRPETIGLAPPERARRTRRARLLAHRPIRAWFLLSGRRVNPLDPTGLGSSTAHLIRHTLGAFHPDGNATYDLQILAADGADALRELRRQCARVVDGTHPHAAFLRDLVVYDGYHDDLLARVDAWLAAEGREPQGTRHDHADATLTAFLTWCARQPDSPLAIVRAAFAGRLDFSPRVGAVP